MKKVTSILAVAAVALAMGACTQQKGGNTPEEPTSGSTYTGLRVSVVSSDTRAVQDDENDNSGRDEESAIANMKFVSAAETKDFTFVNSTLPNPLTTDVLSFWKSGENTYIASPWKTSAGEQNFGLILNKGILTTSAPIKDDIFTLSDTETIAGLTKEGEFTMTTEIVTKTIKDNISKDDIAAISSVNEDKNVFGLNAERIVAQGIVVDATQNKDVKDQGTLSSLKFGGSMGAAKTYVFLSHAGDRQMEDDQWYDGYTSAVDGVKLVKYTKENGKGKPSLKAGKTASDKDAWTSAYLEENAAALTNFRLSEETNLDLFTKAEVANGDMTKKFSKPGFYFLENSMPKTEVAQHRDWAFTRSAYAKVYGTFKPAHVYQMVKTFVKEAGTGKFFDPSTLEGKDQAAGGVEGKIIYVETEVTTFKAGDTFFRGETDKKFYLTSADAKLSNSAPGQKSYMYTDGIVTYRIPWNWQRNGQKQSINGNTRRNNIYVINLTGFKELGLNYDPADPNDPNNPADDNPDEPNTPPDGGDPSFDKTVTYMNVTTTVLQWNVVSRDHEADAM